MVSPKRSPSSLGYATSADSTANNKWTGEGIDTHELVIEIAEQRRSLSKDFIMHLTEDFLAPKNAARFVEQRHVEAAYNEVLLVIVSFLANSPSPQNPVNLQAIVDKETALKALIAAQSRCASMFRDHFENHISFPNPLILTRMAYFTRLNAFIARLTEETGLLIAGAAG